MNPSKSLRSLSVASAAAALAASLLTAAEPGGQPQPLRQPDQAFGPLRAQRMAGMQPRGGMPVEMILNPEQRAQFREEMDGQRDRQRELDEKASKLRREMDEALFAEKLDEKIVREKATALSDIDVERSLIRARAFAKVRPSLSKDQLERLKNLRADAAGGMRPGNFNFRGPQGGDGLPGGPPRPPGEDGGNDVLPPPAPRPPQAPAR